MARVRTGRAGMILMEIGIGLAITSEWVENCWKNIFGTIVPKYISLCCQCDKTQKQNGYE
jgi:hypothetical protein